MGTKGTKKIESEFSRTRPAPKRTAQIRPEAYRPEAYRIDPP